MSYQGTHQWLRNNFGKAKECINPDCERLSNSFDYCLIKGKKMEKNRDNFITLCRRCHWKYDGKSPGSYNPMKEIMIGLNDEIYAL